MAAARRDRGDIAKLLIDNGASIEMETEVFYS